MTRTFSYSLVSLACTLSLTACHHQSGTGGDGDLAGGGDGGIASSDLAGVATTITISPNPATVNVTVQDGTVTTTPLTLSAVDQNNNPVAASFTLDRGELGSLIAATGVFTANGKNAGKATVTATFGAVQATGSLEVIVTSTTAGANASSGTGPQAPDPAPSGGYNGVGGTSLGGAPPAATMTLLDGGSGTDPAFTWLYPYDATVWPRGMLAPLLQWGVPASFHANAIYVHLKQQSFEWKGYFAGTNLVNAPIDAAAWTLATNNNAGDPLVIEIKISDGTNVLGPITESWSVAGSRLRGTVYYNTYNTQLNPGGDADGNGAVLKINPGGFAPELAVPALSGTCHVCHEVSSDGSKLFVATSISSNIGQVFDLQTPTNTPVNYSNGTFTYGGIYPDGSLALLSSQEDYHAYSGSSDLFAATSVSSMSTTGLTSVITRAVTPSFSPNGLRTAFNFWSGPGANGVVASGGRTIAAMDFSCGAPMSSTTCGSAPYAFSGLRELYTDPTSGHYVGWPSFTPDSKNVVFQRTTSPCTDGGSVLNTRSGAQAELWLADVPDVGATKAFDPMALCRANGMDATCTTPYVPTNATHPNDQSLNYEPNVTPIASGGYYWVVFTSRRLYGNVATTGPYVPQQGDGAPVTPPTKKLWVAAIDPNAKPGTDPSHPAFYLPGQEIQSGNMRGFWVREACQAQGTTCETGDECCSGYCNDDGGTLTCGDKPVGCVPEYGKCTTNSDCCGTGSLVCIDGLCSQSSPPIL